VICIGNNVREGKEELNRKEQKQLKVVLDILELVISIKHCTHVTCEHMLLYSLYVFPLNH